MVRGDGVEVRRWETRGRRPPRLSWTEESCVSFVELRGDPSSRYVQESSIVSSLSTVTGVSSVTRPT